MSSLFNSKDIEKEKNLREAFSKIKIEMTDHLEAINGNTSEINSLSEYMGQIEDMMNKLHERIDDIELKLNDLSGKKPMSAEDFKNIILSPKEQEVFLLLYSRTGDLLDYREISRTLGLTEELARKHISSMVSKGIPIISKYFENKVFLILDPDFRNLQAKENIIKIK